MIRYNVSASIIRQRIRALSPTWLERARERTDRFRTLGRYNENSNIWGEIKKVYMELQHNKCAYCERKLEGPVFGTIEHDIEHYRPKNPIKVWPSDSVAARRNINYGFSTGESSDEGYYLLAYHELNYVTACKTCNTPLKSNYFPIAGNRETDRDNPRELRNEKPFLIYPLDSIDKNPEELLTFDGILIKPSGRRGHKYRRAQVTIDFFELDTREELLRGRAQQIQNLYMAFMVLEGNHEPEQRGLAEKAIRNLISDASPHANCARAFLGLYNQNSDRAKQYGELAIEYLASNS